MQLIQNIKNFQNNYNHILLKYQSETGDTLNKSPLDSIANYPIKSLTMNISIIIPTWKSRRTLLLTLKTINESSLSIKFPKNVEVVIIDDGSEDSTEDIINNLNLRITYIYIKQKHLSRSHAINTASKFAKGDIFVFCDSDVLLCPYTLEELIKRQTLFNNEAIFFGFREDIPEASIEKNNLINWVSRKASCFWNDNRFEYDFNDSWSTNMMPQTNFLNKRWGYQNVWVSDNISSIDDCWQLYRMVYGFLFSISRRNFFNVGGFDEDFLGWGWEDSFFIAKAISKNIYIIPCLSAHCFHIEHPNRTKSKEIEAISNFEVLNNKLSNLKELNNIDLNQIDKRILSYKKQNSTYESKTNLISRCEYINVQNRFLSLNNNKALYHYYTSNYEEAKKEFLNRYNNLDIEEIEKLIQIIIITNDFYNFSKIKTNHIKNTFFGKLATYIFYKQTSTLKTSVDSTKLKYCYMHSYEEHIRRGYLFYKEKQYYSALFDFWAAYLVNETIGTSLCDDCLTKLCIENQ